MKINFGNVYSLKFVQKPYYSGARLRKEAPYVSVLLQDAMDKWEPDFKVALNATRARPISIRGKGLFLLTDESGSEDCTRFFYEQAKAQPRRDWFQTRANFAKKAKSKPPITVEYSLVPVNDTPKGLFKRSDSTVVIRRIYGAKRLNWEFQGPAAPPPATPEATSPGKRLLAGFLRRLIALTDWIERSGK